jgi:dephospho-CoA kinase
MKVIGLTGGIGSGKSTVAREFEKLDIPLFIADLEAKNIIDTDVVLKNYIKSLLGTASYIISDTTGTEVADRVYIASKVFKDKELLQGLNAIVHPAVAAKFEKWKHSSTRVYGIYEAAILLETGGASKCDEVLLVAAQKELRIARVMKRDSVTREQVLSRMANQWQQSKKLQLSDIVINNVNFKQIPDTVRFIHYYLLKRYH